MQRTEYLTDILDETLKAKLGEEFLKDLTAEELV